MNTELPPYTRPEFERKFLISPREDWRSAAKPYFKELRDKYLRYGRLRLREMMDMDTGKKTYKLCKKFKSQSSYWQPIVNIYLSEEEYDQVNAMEGLTLSKTRYYVDFNARTFSIDVFKGELNGLVICETEADSLHELMDIRFPPFARCEVTEDAFFTGGKLCRTSSTKLLERLKKIFDDANVR